MSKDQGPGTAMNIDQIQSILGAEIECGVFESVVVPALDVCRKVAASSAATGSDAASVGSDFRDESILSWLRNLRGTGGCNAAAIEHIEELYERLAATVGDAASVTFSDTEIAALRVAADALIERYAAPIRGILQRAEHATTAGTQDEEAATISAEQNEALRQLEFDLAAQGKRSLSNAVYMARTRAASSATEPKP